MANSGSNSSTQIDPQAREILVRQYRDLDEVSKRVEQIRLHLRANDTTNAQHEVDSAIQLLQPLVQRTKDIVTSFDPSTGANPQRSSDASGSASNR